MSESKKNDILENRFSPVELEKSMKGSLNTVQTLIEKTNPLTILVQLYSLKLIENLGDVEATINGDIKPYMNKLIDFTQSLIVSRNFNYKNDLLTKEDISTFRNEVDNLFTTATLYVESTPNEELIKYSQGMQMIVSGNIYPYFEKEHFTDLLFPYTALFEDIYGITSEEVVNGLLEISYRLRTSGYLETLIESGLSLDQEQTKEFFLESAAYFDVREATGWPIDFLDDLCLNPQEYEGFYENHVEVMMKESPIKYKPFLKIEEGYYCFSIDNLIDNFYRTTLRALRKRDKEIANAINSIQQELSEDLPLQLFKKLIPRSKIYKGIYYKAPVGANGRNEWCECDGVIIYDNIMIIIEVKGGSLSPVSPFSNQEAFLKSIGELAKNPYEQSLRFYNEYKKENKIDIYTKKSKKRYSLLSSIEDISFVQACCVTLDDFNELAAQIEKTDIIQSSDLPVWCISINDLRVYPELFNSTSHFLNYLHQRSQSSKNPYIKLNDELDHLGLYFAYNDYSKYVSELLDEHEGTIGEVVFGSYRDEINAYMSKMINTQLDADNDFLEFLLGPTKKPKQEMEFMYENLIKLLDDSRDVQCIRSARYLLMLDSETRGNLNNFLNSRSRKLIQFRSHKQVLTPYMGLNYSEENKIADLPSISVFLLFSNNRLFKDIAQRKRFLMERVMNKNEETYCILIGINNRGQLTKVLTQIISPAQFQVLSDDVNSRLEATRNKISNARVQKTF